MFSIKSLETTDNLKETKDKLQTQKKDISIVEYSLNIHKFNPSKNSPPNNWELRLKNRINSFNNMEDLIL